ncbi:unnamed protein product [Microthlaspi erraticum]|uniref:Integrase catalytic domain-containing protein n=1 Tax=Microthlaspi erraticum TaxID=1685480 RepID=A0A6D2HSU5_9BRAS|nr:unnamed protein product [Microthlaspi erraticum]
MTVSTTRLEVACFDSSGDFSMWTTRMMAHFGVAGLKDVIHSDNFEITVPLSPAVPAMNVPGAGGEIADVIPAQPATTQVIQDPVKLEKDERAKDMIIVNIGDLVLRKIKHCTTAASMWALLERLYMPKSLPNRIFVQSQFYTFKCNTSKEIDINVDDFLKIVAEMNSLNVTVSEEIQAIVFLNALPAAYDQLKHTLKYGKESISLEEVISAARSKQREVAESAKIDSGSATALYTNDRGRQTKRDSGDSRGRSKSKSKSGKKVTCWYCKKEGHVKKDCFARKRRMEADSDGEAAVVIGQVESVDTLTVTEDDSRENWVIDSGCTHHMTSHKDWFIDFKEIGASKILLGDYHSVETQGIGSIRLNTNGGSVKIMHNVRYVPSLRRNLISTGTLDKLDFTHSGEDGKIMFHKNKKLALQGFLKNGLYILDGDTITAKSCQVEVSKAQVPLWHSRLGHMSFKNMQILVNEGTLKQKEVGKEVFCEHCVMGKSKRVSFETGKHDTKHVLDYVHADLWGSPNVQPSLSRNQYFLSIIDDHSRKVWICCIRTKDETFAKFCDWKNLVENQVDRKVKCLRTDNGLEFCNNVFDEFCRRFGIARHRTCTYTPQQNGVAERMNRTIMEKVRCLLSESGLEEKFWAQAAATAVYVINRSPTASIGFKCPEEVWLGKKPGYKHMRKFGALAYVHVDQGKLKPRALKGVFIGYPPGTKGYMVWLLEEGKSVTSRNVKFHEELVYKDVLGKVESSPESSMKTPILLEVVHSDPKENEESQTTDASDQGGASQGLSDDSEELEQETEPTEQARTSLSNYQLARDRPKRFMAPPVRLRDYDCENAEIAFALTMFEMMNVEEPGSFAEAKESKDWVKWNGATDEEMDSLWKNRTWVLVDKPKDRQIISNKWIFTIKPGIVGVALERHKARLVARGFSQREGIDYQEVFAPVVKHVSIRTLLSLVVNLDIELEQMDVKTAFLHGSLEEDIYMYQPEGYVDETQKDKVCLLKKSLYGLKQSPKQWNKRFDQFMKTQAFSRSERDQCVYTKEISADNYIYLLLYVDDMLIAAKEMSDVKSLKEQLSLTFEMKDLGAASRILGMDITRDREEGTLCLSQANYLRKVIENFRMSDAKSSLTPIGGHFKLSSVKDDEEGVDTEVIPYASVVGSIMYAMVGSRPDLAYGIGLVSRFMSKPGHIHWEAVKWLLRYIKGSVDLCLRFTKQKDIQIQGFCDSDYSADLDRRRSISGYVFTVGGNVVSWRSSLQRVAALSTTEAEYISLTEAVKEAIWLKGLLADFGLKHGAVKVWCDSQSAICLSKNNVFHERTKHIAVKYHFIRDVIEDGEVEVLKVHTSRNPADILTKVVLVGKFNSALTLLNIARA